MYCSFPGRVEFEKRYLLDFQFLSANRHGRGQEGITSEQKLLQKDSRG